MTERQAKAKAKEIMLRALRLARADPQVQAYVRKRCAARGHGTKRTYADAVRIVLLEDELDAIDDKDIRRLR